MVGDLRHYVPDYLDDEVREALESALEAAQRLGARVEPATIPEVDRAPGAMLCTIGPEAFDVHRELLARRAGLLPDNVRLRLEAGAFVTAADYVRAGRLRHRLRAACGRRAAPHPADYRPLTGRRGAPVGERWTIRSIMSRFTVLANLSGHPAVTIPWGRDARGTGIGVQLVGSPHTKRVTCWASRGHRSESGCRRAEPTGPQTRCARRRFDRPGRGLIFSKK